jgi:hypothetical protein
MFKTTHKVLLDRQERNLSRYALEQRLMRDVNPKALPPTTLLYLREALKLDKIVR